MNDRKQSREGWEQELRDVQRNVTPGDDLRSAQIIAKNLSASPAPIQDFPHLVRLLLSGIMLVIGFAAFSSDVPHKAALGAAAVAASCYLGVSACRWNRNRS
jgi:hypothetical protein